MPGLGHCVSSACEDGAWGSRRRSGFACTVPMNMGASAQSAAAAPKQEDSTPEADLRWSVSRTTHSKRRVVCCVHSAIQCPSCEKSNHHRHQTTPLAFCLFFFF